MKTRKLVFAIIILSIITGSGNAQKNNSSAPFFFIQLTDPQFGMTESNKGFEKETGLYEKSVNAINRLNPDFVVITGDLVNNKDDRSQVNEFKRITSEINSQIPVYYSPGNHDIGQSPGQKDIDSFVSDYGHDRFAFRHNKNLFIGLNSVIIKANTPVVEELQYNWLRKQLSEGKRAKHIILFCHYPFFINSADEPETYSNIAPVTRTRYLDLFKKYNVNAIFAGHLHDNRDAKYGTMDMITTSAVGKPLGKEPSGIRIVIVYPDRIESRYYGLDEIPEKIFYHDNNNK
jgi:serine/threonine-protein phosphatase CPPED1